MAQAAAVQEVQYGKYIYGLMPSVSAVPLDALAAIDGREGIVHRIDGGRYSAIVSDTDQSEFDPTRRNMLSHTRLLEQAMAAATVLPVRFGTVADDLEQVQAVLRAHEDDFDRIMERIADRHEMGLKVMWDSEREMKAIVETTPELKRERDALQTAPEKETYYKRIDFGRKIEDALNALREQEAEGLLHALAPLCVEAEKLKVSSDKMILNAALLIEAEREGELDALITELSDRYEDRFGFRYVGPVPAYNFAKLSIEWRR